MRCTTRTAAVLALGILAVGAPEAAAAWNDVFQTTGCCRPARSNYAPPPAPCAPSVSYVQRSYYQPVTTYKTETYYEPVTTYRTSYYWEPVTSYKYTSYYDPCTGCCQKVATPQTSYYQRSKSNAVQSYVQRCRTVPVTEMRKAYYLEPVVTSSGCCGDAPPAAVREGEDPPGRIPGAAIDESAEPKRIPPTKIDPNSRKVSPAPAEPIRADRIASNAGRLRGQVVREDRITPRENTVLRFVGQKDEQVLAKADPAGRFAVDLPPGEWSLYVPGEGGKAEFHSTLVVRKTDDRNVTVVSR